MMSTTTAAAAPVLEPAAQAFAEAAATPPFLSDLPPSEGRALVDKVQSSEVAKADVDEEWITIAGGPTGEVKVRIVKPRGATGTLPVVLYIHGAGWVFGDAHTHDRLVRELAVGAGAAVVFPEYDRSPEVHYPVAIERSTPSRSGLSRTAPARASTRPGSPSPATRSAATWLPR
jgi:acetyl esterase